MKYTRLEHPTRGPVHIWVPDNYSPKCGATVFIHGFNLGSPVTWYVDSAVEEFDLAGKAERAHVGSMVIAIASRVGRGKPIHWPSFADLRTFVDDNSDDSIPEWVHVIGHSGGYANIALWLKEGEESIDHVSLLDATYGQFDVFAKWIAEPRRALDICVSKGTRTHRNAARILDDLPGYYIFLRGMDARQNSRVTYYPTRRSHMSWVIDDDVIPVLIHRRVGMIEDLHEGDLL